MVPRNRLRSSRTIAGLAEVVGVLVEPEATTEYLLNRRLALTATTAQYSFD